MGNTESTGLKMCSGDSLYTYANRKSLKEQMNTQRVGYSHVAKPLKTIPGPEFRKQSSQQQLFGQRQQQQIYVKEEPIELQVIAAPTQQAQAQQEPVLERKKSASFNVYVDCIKDQLEEEELPALEEDEATQLETEIRDRQMQCFEGLFGNVIVHDNGLVLYTDLNGEKFCEDFDPESLIKTFPLGISGGQLSKSIWFNDVIERDSCFDIMSAHLKDIPEPPNYFDVMSDPEKYAPPSEGEEDCETVSSVSSLSGCCDVTATSSLSYKLCDALDLTESEEEDALSFAEDYVFDGLGGMQVIVHEDNLILFTDINGDKHCRPYNPHRLTKVFPNGIAGGDLPKSIWFEEEEERDLCFALMQWNMKEVEDVTVPPDVKEYTGLYGLVRLHEDGQIVYTSLTGDVIQSYFEPEEVQPCFPMGISYGGLPKTIWFETAEDRQNALNAMRNM